MDSMEIDEALEATRPLGRTQILLLIVVSLVNIQIAFMIVSVVFYAEVQPHHCALAATGYTINDSIPFQDGVLSRCEEFVEPPGEAGESTQSCSNGWEYETELYGQSIVSEWDLVCERDFLPDLSQTILFSGMAAGSIIAGPISDKYGRKPTAVGGVILFNIIGIAVTFSPNYIVFVTLRFLLATIFKSILIPLNTLLFEFLVPRHRSFIGSIPAPVYTIGLMLLSGIAYLLRDWRYFNLVMMSPGLIIMIISWKLPESARWLLSQGKQEKAETVIRKVAKFNKSSIESITLSCNMSIQENRDVMPTTTFDQISIAENIPASDNKKNNTGSLKDLFKPPTLTVTVILTWLWMSYTLGYFGFALTTGNLAGDPYLNFFLSGLIELPARTLPLFIVKRTGSLLPLIIGFALSSLTMIGIVVARLEAENRGEEHGLDLLLTILALLGKFFAAFVFVPTYLLMVELFPTTMRNSGTGVVQLIGNIGSLAVPLLIYLDKFVLNLPFIIMATASMIASGLCFFLPETLNTVQPETPADLQLLFDSKRLCRRKQKVFQVNSPGGEKTHGLEEIKTISANTLDEDLDQGRNNIGFDP